MKFSTNKKGNALVDLIIGIVILGLVSISVVGAYTSLISMVTNAFRNSQTSWFGNSVMEIYSAKDFDDIAGVDDFILPQFPGYTADITVTHKDIDLSTSTFDGGNEESQYKEIIVAANNVSDNSVTLKTIISAPKKFQQPGSPTDGDIVWFDDFELPPFDDLEERGYDIGANEVTWSIGTDGGANGDNYLTIIGQGSGQHPQAQSPQGGLSYKFDDRQIEEVSWYVRITAPTFPPDVRSYAGYVVAGENGMNHGMNSIFFNYIILHPDYQITIIGGQRFFYPLPQRDPGVNLENNVWYHFEVKNIDYTTKTFDVWVNGAQKQTGINFRDQTVSSMGSVYLYNYRGPYGNRENLRIDFDDLTIIDGGGE